VLRAGLVLVPSFLLLWMGLLAPSLFIRSSIVANKTVEFDAAQFFFVTFGGVMIASVVFSVRIHSRRKQTLEKLLKKTESQDSLLIDQAYLEAGGWRRFYVSWQISMEIAFTTFVFFLFWFAVWVIDIGFLIFALGWICYELLSYLRQSSSSLILRKLDRIAKIQEKLLFDQTFLIGGTSGLKGAQTMGLGLVAIMLSSLFLVVSLKYPSLLLSWLLFCGWYVLIVAIEITRRSNQRIILTREKKSDDIAFRAFPQENLAILMVFLLFMILTMSRYESINVQSRFLPYPLFNAFPNSSAPTIKGIAMLTLLALANLVTIYSALNWAKGRSEKIATTIATSNIADKLKLAWLCILGVLLVGSAYTDIMLALLIFVCSLILGLFISDILSTFRKIAAWKYGVSSASLTAIVAIGALLSLWMLCQNDEKVARFLHPLLFPIGILLSIVIILQGLAYYHFEATRLNNSEKITRVGNFSH
jgi:hypothetical protein